MADRVAAQIYKSSSFQTAWKRALEEYYANLPPEQQSNVNLSDPAWLKVQSVDDLMVNLERRHQEFDKDTGRGTVHSAAIKSSLSGIQTLIGILGGAAGAAFPPSSQILGAVSVLLDAGKKVSGAFDEVSSLFTKIGDFLTQLKVLSQVDMRPELETCVTNILVSVLRICGLATHKAYHQEVVEEVKEGHTIRRTWNKVKQKTMSKGSEYLKQLLLGDDPDISGAVSQLQRGVDAEQRMIAAITMNQTTEIKAVSVHIGELSNDIYETTIGVQREIREMSEQVIEIGTGIRRVETGFGRMESGQIRVESEVVAVKDGVGRVEAELTANNKLFANKFDELSRAVKSGIQTSARLSKTDASKSKELSNRLRTLLHPESASQKLFTKFKQERVKGTSDWILEEPIVEQWLKHEHKYPVLIVSGNTGSGKTFLATRIIEKLQDRFKSDYQDGPTSLAYFFCRKNPTELSSVIRVLRTLAFQISEIDAAYTSHISAENRMKLIENPETVGKLWDTLFASFFKANPSNSTILIIDGIDECQNDNKEAFQDFVKALQDCIQESTWAFPNVRLMLVVARDNAEKLTTVLGESACHFVVDDTHTLGDIDTIVKSKLSKEWKGNMVPTMLREAVHKTVKKHCKGDFLRTSLILEELTSLSREDDIWALLSRPPKSVAEATSLVLRRLRRSLDGHGLEDLVDILAWVSCSHSPLSLATLDAILTVRNYEGSRLINLRSLIEDSYTALFIPSERANSGFLRAEDEVRRRLGLKESIQADSALDPDSSAPVEVDDYEKQLLKQYHVPDNLDDPKQKLAELANIEVRLADNISDPDQLEVVTRALTTENLKCKTLLGCLKIMCDPPDSVDKDAADRANEYCARNFGMHLLAVDVDEVEAKKTREIVRLLLKVLRDETVIDRYIKVAVSDEHLLESEVEDKLLAWLQSLDIQGRLPSTDLDWISKAVQSPTASLLDGLARGHARRWLTQDSAYDFVSNFSFINIYRSKLRKAESEAKTVATEQDQHEATEQDQNGPVEQDQNETTEHYQHEATEQGPHEATETSTTEEADGTEEQLVNDQGLVVNSSILSSSAEEILEAAEWAGLKKDSRWHRRVGEALDFAEKYEEAIAQYQEALTADSSDPRNHHSLGMAYFSSAWDYEDTDKRTAVRKQAISSLLKAVDLYNAKISEENGGCEPAVEDEQACSESKYFLAFAYRNIGELDAAEKVYKGEIAGWEERDFEKNDNIFRSYAACQYISMLTESSRNPEAMALLGRIVRHPQSRTPKYHPIYSFMMYSSSTLMQLAYKTEGFDVLNEYWQRATFVVACRKDEGEEAQLRWFHAHAMARLRPHRREHAIGLLKMISEDPEAEHWTVEAAEKELARIYLDLALECRDVDRWSDVDKYFWALNALARKSDAKSGQNFKDNESALFLAAWFRLHRRFEQAKEAVKPLLDRQLTLLYDDELDNDVTAWYIIANLTLVVGDTERAMAATNMKGSIHVYGNQANIVKPEADTGENDEEQDATASNETEPPQTLQQDEPRTTSSASNEPSEAPIEKATYSTQSSALPATDNPSIVGAGSPDHPNGSRSDKAASESEGLQPSEAVSDKEKADVAVDSATASEVNGTDAKDIQEANGSSPSAEGEGETASGNDTSQVEANKGEDENENKKSRGYTCDGPCFNDGLPYKDPLYRCSICSADFCEPCWSNVKSGEYKGFTVCSSTHDWVAMPPVEKCPENMIRFKGKDVPILEWLDDLADAWGIERRTREAAVPAASDEVEGNASMDADEKTPVAIEGETQEASELT